MSAKILFYDIETSPNIGFTWGKYDQHVPAFIQEVKMLCVSYKWSGENNTSVATIRDFPGYKPGITKVNDKGLTEFLWGLFDEADVLIAHNGKNFDDKVVRTRFLDNQLAPPSPWKSIDTLQQARKLFKLNSNKLDDLGQYLGLGRKVAHEGMSLWIKCMEGDEDAWKRMVKYAKQDVVLLEKVYDELRPWMTNLPNLAQFEDDPLSKCPKCTSARLTKRGTYRTNTATYQRLQCQDCGAWTRASKSDKQKNSDMRGI